MRSGTGGGGVASGVVAQAPQLAGMILTGVINAQFGSICGLAAPEARANPHTYEASASRKPLCSGLSDEADDGPRTRDPQLGKLVLYQLSYVRVPAGV